MNVFGKIFGKAQPTSSAPREFVDMLGRFARTVEEAAQGRESDAGSLAREVRAELVRLGVDVHGLNNARRTIAARIGIGRHPAEVAAELYTGFVLFDARLFGYSQNPATTYKFIYDDFAGQVLRGDDNWALAPALCARALRTALRLAAEVELHRFGSGQIVTPIISRAIASGDPMLRDLVRDLIEAVVSSEPNRIPYVLDEADKWRDIAGFARSEIPTLAAQDAKAPDLESMREALFREAGEPLATLLRFALNGELSIYGSIKGGAWDELMAQDKAARGRALAVLLDRIMPGDTYQPHAKLTRHRGRWAHEYGKNAQPGAAPLDRLALEIAKRAHDLPDPDKTHAQLASLMAQRSKYLRETNRNLLKTLLKTAVAHPRGKTAAALERLANTGVTIQWKPEVEKALREARRQAEGGPQPAAESIRPLPDIVIGDYRHIDKFRAYCGDLFDPRLYDEPHDSYLRAIASFGNMVAEAQAAGEPNAGIGPAVMAAMRAEGFAVTVPQGARPEHFIIHAHEFFAAALDAYELRETLKAAMRNDPDLLHELAVLVGQVAGKAAPGPKWIAQARALVAKLPTEVWIDRLRQATANELRGRGGSSSENYIRTLIYGAAFLPPEDVGPLLVQYALKKCYVTEPGIGIRSEKLGNACVWALANLPDGAGVPYLARILARTKYPKIRKKIDEQLNAAASAAGVSRADLDEVMVPTHDLDAEGRRVVAFENGTATLIAEGSSARIDWANAEGKPVKAATTAMKAEKALMKALQADLKELQADLAIQPQRLQRLYLQDRSWPAEVWRERYLEQPLMRGFARRLVWQIEREGHAPLTALPDAAGAGLWDCAGAPAALDSATIRLWHPMMSPVEEVEAWRLRLEELRVTQPFAQAWREVYALTDAERATATYSNRWAAHILKQQQAMNLARINGWTVTGRVWFDTANDQPWHLHMPEHGLVAEYWVEGAGGDDPETTDSGAYAYVNTDRVTFFRATPGAADSARGPSTGDPLPLAGIPPVVFSEVMRACDLFTAVASIAADPTWLDRGQEAQHPSQWGQTTDAYWRNVNTGDLVESGKRRHAMLARIVPRLAIADKLSLSDKALVVKGTRHTYEIHLGSGAASRSGRHICIVPKNTAPADKVWLPFEGDRTLSIIISKAVLLAADDTITDPVIIAQI
ncbi:DUF4132 domain-containing protein [Erythrobacter donghaensis]|uniref:DUF4132 domain-containing protein n=1 Tax=Erythrobacter donghaensis TaxID=267135 RepID=UPI000A3AC50B|nr:DUF4132 domain-containing protein [Erythrobacter donghaensis]